MEWNGMQVTITNQDGEIFAEHELGPVAASPAARGRRTPRRTPSRTTTRTSWATCSHSLESAADNVRRGAVTDDNNLILSERG